MTELLDKLLGVLGHVAVGLFGGVLLTLSSGYFFKWKSSPFWRTLVAYLGNVNTEGKADTETHRKKPVRV